MIVKCEKKTCKFNNGVNQCTKKEITIKDFKVEYIDFAICQCYDIEE